MPLGASVLDNKEPLSDAPMSLHKQAMTRVVCNSAQFYAGNERSTSLVTAIPAETHQGSESDVYKASLVLKNVLMGKHLLSPQTPADTEADIGSSALPLEVSPIESASSIELSNLNLNVSPQLGDAQAKPEAYVHFASPLAVVNTYTPEMDPSSGSTDNSSSANTSHFKKLPLSPQYLTLKQAIVNAEAESSSDSASSANSSQSLQGALSGKVASPEELDEVLRGATKGASKEFVRNYQDLMFDLAMKTLPINSSMEQYALSGQGDLIFTSPLPPVRRHQVTKR